MGRVAEKRRALAGLAFGGAVLASAGVGESRPAPACGITAPTACAGDAAGTADDALWMLRRVVAAVRADEVGALRAFSDGANGFQTSELYVFCIGAADGRISAHPEPMLMGQDARALRDPAGHAFAAEMLDRAEEGSILEVHYLFPRPGRSAPVPKTSFVTRVKDQVCGVGYYG